MSIENENIETKLPIARLRFKLPMSETEQVVELVEGQTYRIGRAKGNDLILDSQEISRNHALLSVSAAGAVLSDLSSLNGTFLNGRRLNSPIDVASGDEVVVDMLKIKVEILRDRSLLKKGSLNELEVDSTQATRVTTSIVSVLVVDICGYTKLSQSFPSMDVVEMLDRWFNKVSSIVHQHGGEVDKYIGDCVLALWKSGADEARVQAANAVKAAVDIISETKTLGQKNWKHSAEQSWTCRCAINTGEAVIGAIGGISREYTVLGDTVNIAFRIEKIASKKQLDIILSLVTANYVKNVFVLEPLGKQEIDGRVSGIELFSLKG